MADKKETSAKTAKQKKLTKRLLSHLLDSELLFAKFCVQSLLVQH